ncbi:MAG: NADH-ubiquinone oxidoreductase-F iron-sulfur binding region domain-containing protein [Thermoanaerobacteraceae bacterium]|jgi:NAD-dependent dihydropyrimidine dehydrogenase PreA subunit|nr:NADH-ubiquinone oxidoreductase-F iron-sulfur binding region domain-containing protein [Thermoanaerobacteraceae bacterium]
MSEALCAVTRAYQEYMEFTEEQLCGRCIPCMAAAPMIIDVLERLRRGDATAADVDQLERICAEVYVTALCKHGQKAVANLSQAVKDYREAFSLHAEAKRCPERSCTEILRYQINPERCTQCDRCREVCPAGAVVGEPYVPYRADNYPYVIIQEKCTRCSACLEVCADKAIEVV